MKLSLLLIVIVLVLIVSILLSLGVSLFYLVRDQGKTKNTVRALTVRIVLSLVLFFLLLFTYWNN